MCSLLAPNSTVTDCELHSITIMVDITVCEWSFLEVFVKLTITINNYQGMYNEEDVVTSYV